jgi:F0F1-type ATP synthase membrane subunit a
MKKGQALAAVVLTHHAISLVHGRAHQGAQVPLPFAGTLFVYIVILAGPLVGLGLSRWRPRAGAWIVALTMAGALIFGLVNHFLIDGSDHVANVAAEWRSLFGTTAVLLLLSEAAGVAIGVWAGSAAHTGVGD